MEPAPGRKKPAPLPFLNEDTALERALEDVLPRFDCWSTPSMLITPEQIAAWLQHDYSVSAAGVKVDGREIGAFFGETGLFADARAFVASNYSADVAHLVPGGSSMGNQIVGRLLKKLGISPILFSRNLHHSALDACVSEGTSFRFLPSGAYLPEFEALLPPTPEQVGIALQRHRDTGAVVITSPTYEGLEADIAGIAAVIAAHNRVVLDGTRPCLLIVDAAWGGHFPFSPSLPDSALMLGADLMLTSCHKCAGGMQSSALVLARDEHLDAHDLDQLAAAHAEIATTSPPAVVLTSIIASQQELAARGEAHIDRLIGVIDHVRERLAAELPKLKLLEVGDKTKLTVSVAAFDIDGYSVKQELAEHEIIPEKAGAFGVTFLSTFQLPDGAADRLVDALKAIVAGARRRREPISPEDPFGCLDDTPIVPPAMTRTMSKAEIVPVRGAVGRVAAQRAELYPPGIPIVVPGYRITEAAIDALLKPGAFVATAAPWRDRLAVVPVETVEQYQAYKRRAA